MNYVVIHHMLQDVTEEMIQPHVKYLKELFNKGKLIITGPFLDKKGGGMFVIDVDSEEELMEIVNNDPAIKNGIAKSEVRPYKIVFRD
ncbi:MAG: YciI family protein, partial [Bacteroidota bacterium]|nr:YciI family protein [Bacteroidota bacterium]